MGNDEYQYSNYRFPTYQNPSKPIIITTTKFDYFKGDYVEGNITLQNQIPIVLSDIFLNLYLLESWTYKDSNQIFGELNTQPLLCVKVGINKILKIETELINLSVGVFNFPFKFRLPDYLQPSFEFPLENRRGYIRYSLEAKFISPYVQGASSIYLILKARPKVLNSPFSYSSIMNIHKWGLFDQGTTQLKVSYSTNNYSIKDSIPLKIEINNMRGKLKVTSCEVNMYRKIGYRKKNEDKNKFEIENVIVNSVYQVDVAPMNQRTYDFLLVIKDKDVYKFNYTNSVNPYPNIVDILYLMPSVDGVILKCDYRIEVTLFFDSFVTSGYLPKVSLPVSITHQTQNEFNLEKQEEEDLKRAIEASKLDIGNNNNVNMSVVDKNRIDEMIDKPNGYEIQKMEPISQSQLIDNDNDNDNALPSKNEIENNNNNNQINNNPPPQNNNININQINNINQNNNMNLSVNNYKNNNININQNNYGNGNMNMPNNNYLRGCPAPAINNKNEDDDDLFSPYMAKENSKNNNNSIPVNSAINRSYPNYNNMNNNQNLNNNSNINQMSNVINNNYPKYNNANSQILNNNNINNYSNPNQINNNNNPDYNNIRNPYNSQMNNEINNNYPNYNIIKNQNDNLNNNNNINNNNINNHIGNGNSNNNNDNNNNNNQMNSDINNRYPDFNNLSNINNQNNDNVSQNSNQKNENIQERKIDNDFSVFNEGNEENKNNENKLNNEEKKDKFYDINEI